MSEKGKQKQKTTTAFKVWTVVGIVLCILLVPILIINCTLIIKGYTNSDKVPSFGGVFPMIVLTDSMSGTFESGDLIICDTEDPANVREGDIICYYDPMGSGSTTVTHRVTQVTTAPEGGIGSGNDVSQKSVLITAGNTAKLKFEVTVSSEEYYCSYLEPGTPSSVNGYHVLRKAGVYICLPKGVSIAGKDQVTARYTSSNTIMPIESVQKLTDCTINGQEAAWWYITTGDVNITPTKAWLQFVIEFATDIQMQTVNWDFRDCIAVRAIGQNVSWNGALGVRGSTLNSVAGLKSYAETYQTLAAYLAAQNITDPFSALINDTDGASANTGSYQLAFAADNNEGAAEFKPVQLAVQLVDKTTYGLTVAQSADNALGLTANYTVNKSSGDDTYASGKGLAIVLAPTGALPADAVLAVGDKTYERNAQGDFIVPIDNAGESGSIDLTLKSEMFPDAAADYGFTAVLYRAKSSEAASPMNGEKVAEQTNAVTLTKAQTVRPAIRVSGTQVAAASEWAQGQDMSFEVSNLDGYTLTATAYTGLTGTSTSQRKTDLLSNIGGVFDIQNGTGIYKGGSGNGKLTLNGSTAAGTYRIIFEIKDTDGNVAESQTYVVVVKR